MLKKAFLSEGPPCLVCNCEGREFCCIFYDVWRMTLSRRLLVSQSWTWIYFFYAASCAYTQNRRMAVTWRLGSLEIQFVLNAIMVLLSVSCRHVPTVYGVESTKLYLERDIWKTSPSCSGLPMPPGKTTSVWASTMELMAGGTLTTRVSQCISHIYLNV